MTETNQKRYSIYKLTNTVTGKHYIGLTGRDVDVRWKQHQQYAKNNHTNYRLYLSMRKHGCDKFVCETMMTKLTKKEALDLEIHLIAEYNSYQNGYNATPGGDHYISSEWQRANQLKRVAAGTHPFIGGQIQSISSKRRWDEDTSSIKGLNQERLAAGTHNFQGSNNPQHKIVAQGKHHNQQEPWNNSNANIKIWALADKLYEWYLLHGNKKRGGSYRAMQKAFNLDADTKPILKHFRSGWIPAADPAWICRFG